MPRKVGDRYSCAKCGAQLVYEKACPCPPTMVHAEICCGEQMALVKKAPAKVAKTSKSAPTAKKSKAAQRKTAKTGKTAKR